MPTAFVFGINMSVAGIFALAFAIIAATNRSAHGAWWLALGYGMGIIYVGLEFLLTQQVDPTPVGIGIFLVFLLALSFALIGGALHYRVAPPWIAMAAIWVLTILAVTALGFLGLGIQPPTPEWGVMIAEGRNFIFDGWWGSVFPGLAIAYVGVAFALLGDGLEDLLRPKQ